MKTGRTLTLKVLIFLCSTLALNGCGEDNDSTVVKKQPIATEQEMSADNTVALSNERNAVLFLQDPDDESMSRNWFSSLTERVKAAASKANFKIPEPGTYQICQNYPEHMDHRIQVVLADSSGNELLRTTDEGCKSVEIPGVEEMLSLEVAKLSDQIAEDGREPAFLTMQGNTITMNFNQCIDCDLNGLDLTGRHLIGTDLTGANLTDAKIKDTILSFVHLEKSSGLFENGLPGAVHHSGDLTQIMERGFWHDVTHPKETASKVVHKVEHAAKDLHKQIVHITDDFVIDALDQAFEDDGGDLNIHNVSFARAARAMKREIVDPPLADVVYHTYLELEGYNGETYAWGAFGHNSGGDVLEETTCDGDTSCIDSHTVAFMMHEPPCRWPTAGYAQVGVCWNLTNRGLFYTGKTVDDVPYYAVVEGLYGTYGGDHVADLDFAVAPFTMDKCLEAQEAFAPWHGHDFGVRSSSTMNRSLDNEDVNPRIALYQQYRNDIKSRSVDGAEYQKLGYLQDLFRLNIAENLENLDQETTDELLDIHEKYFYLFQSIKNTDQSGYIEEFNSMMKDQLSEYKEVLGEEDYLKLMNLETETKFDLGQIL